MSDTPTDPTKALAGLLASARGVKLGSGVVGKTGHLMWGLLAMWIVIVIKLDANLWLDAALIGIGLFVTMFTAWFVLKTHAFAERNPAQAMLEGAEFLEYHKFEVQAKGIPASTTIAVEELKPVNRIGGNRP